MRVDKARLEGSLAAAWDELVAAVNSVPEDEMETPGVVEEWSVKDILGHIAFWGDKGAGDLYLLAEGRAQDIETPGGEENVNLWNRREADARKGLSLEEIRGQWLASFDHARAALARVPVDTLETEVGGHEQWKRFAGDTYLHYREHAEQIRAWERALETTEA